VLAIGSPARAQPSVASATAQFDRGRVLMKEKKYGEACAAFELSHKLDPQSGTLYNLADCYTHTGKLASAWAAYRDLAQRDANLPRRKQSAKLAAALENSRALEKELARLKVKMATGQGQDLAAGAVDVKGVKVLAAQLDGADPKTLRDTLDQLKGKLKTSAIVLAASEGEKVSLIAGVTQDLIARVKAGELVNFVASQVGGKGGGRPDMAQAGGTNPKALPEALASVKGWVEERL